MGKKIQSIFSKKAPGALAGFLTVMVLLTILSRAAANVITPYVKVVSPESGSLVYEVSASGTVEENEVRAVNVAGGIRVDRVMVREGDQVKKGDPLFKVDMGDLDEKILLKNQEIEKLELGISDIREKKAEEQTDKELAQRRAGEDYVRTADSTNVQVQRTYEAMMLARERLNEAQNPLSGGDTDGEIFSSGDDIQHTLEAACEEKEQIFEQETREVKRLEKALEEALAQNIDTYGMSQTDFETEQAVFFGDSSQMQSQSADLSVEQLKKELQAAKARRDEAEIQRQEAQKALEQYLAQQQTENNKEKEKELEALSQALSQATDAYEDALRQQREGLKEADRKIEDTQKPQVRDSTQRTMELDREVLEMELRKYLVLKKSRGKVKAPADGVIRKVDVEVGYATPETSAVTMADTSADCSLTAAITTEQAAYIKRGDELTLKPADGSKTIEGLTVHSMKKNPQDPELTDISVRITDDRLPLGASATLKIQKKSEPYPVILPVQALHLDENQYYVLVLAEAQTVLGTELHAQRMDVKVLEKTAEMAAVEEGALSWDQQVIISAEKPVKDGDRVRLEEEE